MSGPSQRHHSQLHTHWNGSQAFPAGSAGKESTCSVGDLGSIPGLGRSPEQGKDPIVHGVSRSWTRLSDFHFFQERYVRLNLRKSANAAVGAFSPQAPESIFSIPLSDPNTCVPAQSLQVCPALWDPMDCNPPDSSVHGILQARILEWGALPSSGGSSWLRHGSQISCASCIGQADSLPLGHWGSPTQMFT